MGFGDKVREAEGSDMSRGTVQILDKEEGGRGS